MKLILTTLIISCFCINALAQQVPSKSENLDYLVTFGKEADSKHGDDSKKQTLFFLIPSNYSKPIYIRIFDPEVGGKLDEANGNFNTKIKYSIYSGTGTHSKRKMDRKGNLNSGTQVLSKTFNSDSEYDNNWVTLGPFNPVEGELVSSFGGYVFKMVIEGLSGDDGNLYKCFMSSKGNENVAIPGGNTFTYKYCVRLKSQVKSIAHFYAFIDSKVKSIQQHNFDLDGDGKIILYSVSKNGILGSSSGDNEWKKSKHMVTDKERGNSIDIQLIKKGNWDNDFCLFVTNQYGDNVPLFSSPLGGIPKYQHSLNIRHKGK